MPNGVVKKWFPERGSGSQHPWEAVPIPSCVELPPSIGRKRCDPRHGMQQTGMVCVTHGGLHGN